MSFSLLLENSALIRTVTNWQWWYGDGDDDASVNDNDTVVVVIVAMMMKKVCFYSKHNYLLCYVEHAILIFFLILIAHCRCDRSYDKFD